MCICVGVCERGRQVKVKLAKIHCKQGGQRDVGMQITLVPKVWISSKKMYLVQNVFLFAYHCIVKQKKMTKKLSVLH